MHENQQRIEDDVDVDVDEDIKDIYIQMVNAGVEMDKINLMKICERYRKDDGSFMLKVGRNATTNDIVINELGVSREHAIIEFQYVSNASDSNKDNVWNEDNQELHIMLTDLNSTHGTKVNRQKIDAGKVFEIYVGDCIKFGESSNLCFILGPERYTRDISGIRHLNSSRASNSEVSKSEIVAVENDDDHEKDNNKSSHTNNLDVISEQQSEKIKKMEEKVQKSRQKREQLQKEIDRLLERERNNGLSEAQENHLERLKARINDIDDEIREQEEEISEEQHTILSRKRIGEYDDGNNENDEFFDRTQSKSKKKQKESLPDSLDALKRRQYELEKRLSILSEQIKGLTGDQATTSSLSSSIVDTLDTFMTVNNQNLEANLKQRLESDLVNVKSKINEIESNTKENNLEQPISIKLSQDTILTNQSISQSEARDVTPREIIRPSSTTPKKLMRIVAPGNDQPGRNLSEEWAPPKDQTGSGMTSLNANFEAAVGEGNTVKPASQRSAIEKDFFVLRSQIAAGEAKQVLNEISSRPASDVPVDIQAVKLLAMYESQPHNRDTVLATLKTWLNDSATANNPSLQLIAGVIYAKHGYLTEALKAIRQGTTLEMIGLAAHIYLKMDRVDLAEKQLKQMQSIDDDATLTQIVQAMIGLCKGGERYKEATLSFREQIDKWQKSDMLVNGLAASLMHSKRFEEAEKALLESINEFQPSSETLINLIVCMVHLRRPQASIDKYFNDLKAKDPEHPWLQSQLKASSAFDRASASFGPSGGA